MEWLVLEPDGRIYAKYSNMVEEKRIMQSHVCCISQPVYQLTHGLVVSVLVTMKTFRPCHSYNLLSDKLLSVKIYVNKKCNVWHFKSAGLFYTSIQTVQKSWSESTENSCWSVKGCQSDHLPEYIQEEKLTVRLKDDMTSQKYVSFEIGIVARSKESKMLESSSIRCSRPHPTCDPIPIHQSHGATSI